MAEVVHGLPVSTETSPPRGRGVIGWLRANLFNSLFNSILTLLVFYLLALTIPPALRWAFVDAVWQAPSGQDCRAAVGPVGGACWAFIGDKLRFILFGRYPYAEQWRPLLVVAVFVALIVASCNRRLWGRRLVGLWLAGLVAVGVLMWGVVLGLSYVETSLWSGLPLTLI